MLVVAYKINSNLVIGVNEAGGNVASCPGITLILLTVLFSGWNLTFIILQFIWFDGCGINNFFMSVTLIIGIAMYAIVFFRTRDDASIFTSSLVLSYHLYL
mmetsp:Transcript_16315/g.22368  ORF Transcript_16315/g.22368 Transcript_16315/m.22368 type:complete len:101 (+) Transcript_16315:511-813(+)